MADIGMAEVIESGIMRCWCRRSDCSILSMLIFIALSALLICFQYVVGGGDCAEGWRARMITRLKFIRVVERSLSRFGLTLLLHDTLPNHTIDSILPSSTSFLLFLLTTTTTIHLHLLGL